MNSPKFFQKLTGIMLAMVFLVGCTTSTPTPPPPSPSFPPPPVQHPTFLPPPTFQPAQPTGQTSLFKHIQTVQVTLNEHSSIGESGHVQYIPATDRIIVIVQTKVDQPINLSTGDICESKVIGYVEYTTDMYPTGGYGYFACGFADVNSRMVGNDLYIVKMRLPLQPGQEEWFGWTLEKYNAVTWERLASIDVKLDYPIEQDGGPDPSYVNGQVVITGEYRPENQIIGATHNHLFTADLTAVKTIYLQPPEIPSHYMELSLLQLTNGDILMFTSNHDRNTTTTKGRPVYDLYVLRFDKDWQFQDQKFLLVNGSFAKGSATDGQYTYIAYLEGSKDEGAVPLIGMNSHLAAFDTQWNLIQDEALTDVQSTPDPFDFVDGPWLSLHGNRLFVSYVINTLDPDTHALIYSQTYVDAFELTQKP